MKTIPSISKETLLIKDYFADMADGAIVPYEDIQKATGVVMDAQGKQKIRTALNSLKREYACIRGYGVEIESEKNALDLVNHRLIKVDNAVKRGEKTSTNMTKFIPAMSQDNARRLLHVVSIFGAIRLSAELARKEFKNRGNGDAKISN